MGVFDYHVHVTGRPVESYSKDFIKDALKNSLKESGVDGFLGIVAAGTLFPKKQLGNSPADLLNGILKLVGNDFGLLCDYDSQGLSIVRELGGTPAVFVYPYSCRNDSYVRDLLNQVKNEGIKVLKVYTNSDSSISNLLSKASDYGVTTLLLHTPKEVKYVLPVIDEAVSKDLQVILGHGCYDNIELILKVKNSGVYVDTSINPLSNIQNWISNGLEKQLVFGSDWPTSEGETETFDWNAQKREKNKIKEIENIITKNKVII